MHEIAPAPGDRLMSQAGDEEGEPGLERHARRWSTVAAESIVPDGRFVADCVVAGSCKGARASSAPRRLALDANRPRQGTWCRAWTSWSSSPPLRPSQHAQYLTLQPYGVVLATVTGLPAIASSAPRARSCSPSCVVGLAGAALVVDRAGVDDLAGGIDDEHVRRGLGRVRAAGRAGAVEQHGLRRAPACPSSTRSSARGSCTRRWSRFVELIDSHTTSLRAPLLLQRLHVRPRCSASRTNGHSGLVHSSTTNLPL